ncbi:MAG: transglycosylase domain-containing protein [Acidimicrobiales bacterium]
MRSFLIRFSAIVGVAAVGMVGTTVALTPSLARLADAGGGEPEPINLDPLASRSLMFDRHGNQIAVLYEEENRSPVVLAEVPPLVVDTILAVEDENFYEHSGVNIRAGIRALFENVESGSVEQGASTITMQVVRLALLTRDQDLSRKTREIVLAMRLEEQMTKDEILERYLNTVYLGNHAYGVQAGAEVYFGKSVQELDWGEAALLAAIIRSPIAYDPLVHPEVATERRHIALQRLVTVGKITQEQADQYSLAPLPTQAQITAPLRDYFVEDVVQQLLDDDRLGATEAERHHAVFFGGLRVHTTFDASLQQMALDGRASELPSDGSPLFSIPTTAQYCASIDSEPTGNTSSTAACFRDERERIFTNGTVAIASVEPATGAIRAMVGGPGYDNYQYNIASQGVGRPTGSSFKVFVLLALLENGYVPNDTVNGGSPCSFRNPGGTPDPYRAENFEGGSGGSGTITSQTLRSSNCAYLRLGQVVGIDKVIDMAHRLGVTSPLDEVMALPIGTEEVTPLQMAAAYAAIANEGIFNQPYYIERIEDSAGNVIVEHQPSGVRAMTQQTARLAAEVLEGNVRSGTGTRARLPDQPAAGKTGTAQDYADAWFVGFTPQLSTAVWMGALGGHVPMRSVGNVGRVTGGSYPARTWGAFMTAAMDGQEVIEFAEPESTRRGRYLRAPNDRSPTRSVPAATTTTVPGAPPPGAPPPPAPPSTAGPGEDVGD